MRASGASSALRSENRGSSGQQLPNQGATRQWYVATVHSHKENCAVDNLKRQGFHTFAPRFYRQRRRAGKCDTVLTPVFPGYVFVAFDVERDAWQSINSTYGVRHLVAMRQCSPQPVPHPAMELLQHRCRDGIMTRLLDDLKPGAPVYVHSGPLAGQIATLETLRDAERVNVLLNILGSPQSVTLSVDQLGPVP